MKAILLLHRAVFALCLTTLAMPLLATGTGSEAEGNRKTVRGYIRDENGEELIGATIFVESLNLGTATNFYGFYSLSLDPGAYKLTFSYMGYQAITQTVDLSVDNKVIDISLQPATELLEEVQVTAERQDANVQKIEMGIEKVEIKNIKKIPLLMGEADIIKSIQLLPGVQVVGEGGSGFYVRGGGVDQNLILLDDATVYNVSHLGGFFSVFNSDAVKNVELYKGSTPARYGGRLSSVLDVRAAEGNTENYTVEGGIGLPISSRLTVKGPIVKGKSSFIVSGRRTYIDLFFPVAGKLLDQPELENSKLHFHDFNAKVNYIINDNNRVFLSGYFGRDVVGFGDLFVMDYGNTTGT
ncbi:MAG: TonB-dependent receptor plug domain-containing protein [Bacteroidales bacterium]|nr:TonB-dependent receptor plug domain-containing protein [Bacteroidales bacterium]